MLLQIIKVSGRSLDPLYRDGDFVLVSKIPLLWQGIRPGDVVVFQHPKLGRLIKLVERLEEEGSLVHVVGLDAWSSDSRTFGPISRAQIQGKVIWHFTRR